MGNGVKFKAGDIVQLRTGGPKMVVETWQGFNQIYKCTWFIGGKHNSTNFKEEALEAFTEGAK